MIPGELFASISLYLIISDERWNIVNWICDYDSVEPVTLSNYVAEYEQMWKWMSEFLRKFQSRGIKIDRANSIRVANSMIFFNILRVFAP